MLGIPMSSVFMQGEAEIFLLCVEAARLASHAAPVPTADPHRTPADRPSVPAFCFPPLLQGVQLHRFRPDQEASVVLPLQPGNYEVREDSLRLASCAMLSSMHHPGTRQGVAAATTWLRVGAVMHHVCASPFSHALPQTM